MLCFINHGCNSGDNNVGYSIAVTQATVDPITVPFDLNKFEAYNPVVDRQVQFHFYSSALPLRPISKGEELLENYLTMCGKSKEYWDFCVHDLRDLCDGNKVGYINEYEAYFSSKKRRLIKVDSEYYYV